MPSITFAELELILRRENRCQFVELTCLTDPDIRKRDNPHRDARKLSTVRGLINWRYANSVNNQRKREAVSAGRPAKKFEAVPRRWGTREKKSPLVLHVPEATGVPVFYLELKREFVSEMYFDPTSCRKIDERKLRPFLRSKPKPTRQATEKEIVLRDYKLSNIAEIAMGGQRYTVAPAATELQTYLKQLPTRKRSEKRSGSTANGAAV